MTTTDQLTSLAAEYRAATTDVAFYDASANGRLRMTERDRADLLHRLSTNDIAKLQAGSGVRTVLINHNARIIDLITVYALPEHLMLVTSPGQGPAVRHLLRKNIFFQDRVVVEDITATTLEYHLYGPQAAKLVGEIGSVDPGDWPMHHIQAVSISAGGVSAAAWIARELPIGSDRFVIYARTEDRDTVRAALGDTPELDAATADILRVEQGAPAWEHELSLEYIPLEAGLLDAICFTKGCYVGQEIIARMESRNRLAKRLMGLRLPNLVEPGGKLRYAGKEAGDLTSVIQSPRFGAIGLGYVRTAAAEPGTVVQVADGVEATVVELPFTA